MTVVSENNFRSGLEALINQHNREFRSSTPDFVLAQFLHTALLAFDTAVNVREDWYKKPAPEIKLPHAGEPTIKLMYTIESISLGNETGYADLELRPAWNGDPASPNLFITMAIDMFTGFMVGDVVYISLTREHST